MMLRPVQQPASVFAPFAKGKQQAVTPHDGRSVVWGRGPASPAGPVGAPQCPRLCRNYSSPSDGAAFTALRRCLALVWR